MYSKFYKEQISDNKICGNQKKKLFYTMLLSDPNYRFY